MKNIYVLVGQSASGKDTLLNNLLNLGIGTKLVSHTSRPIRNGEIEGKSYYFKSRDWFEENKKDFIQLLEFNNWYYGLHKEELNKEAKTLITILSPKGIELLRNHIDNEHIKVIYLKVDEHTRRERLLFRNDDIVEINRRLKTDKEDFKDINKLNPYVIDGTLSPVELVKIVSKYIKEC